MVTPVFSFEDSELFRTAVEFHTLARHIEAALPEHKQAVRNRILHESEKLCTQIFQAEVPGFDEARDEAVQTADKCQVLLDRLHMTEQARPNVSAAIEVLERIFAGLGRFES